MFFLKKKSKSMVYEAYRSLRVNLQHVLKTEDAKSILVTSAEGRDGKTTVVKNIALSFVNMGKSVIVIDCDFRTCKLSELLEGENRPGISDVVLEKEELKFAIEQSKGDIAVLPAGRYISNTDKVLCSTKMIDVLSILKESYDVILIDSPAVNEFADAQVLAQIADLTVLVVKSGVSKPESVLEGKSLLEKVGAKICGTILVNK